MTMDTVLLVTLERIADALERLAPSIPGSADLSVADAFVWQPESGRLIPVPHVAGVAIDMLQGVDRQKQLVLENTERFAAGLP
ncbi:MAG: DUF815 domain-containing protein, partial [Janthinobacterium lividum]